MILHNGKQRVSYYNTCMYAYSTHISPNYCTYTYVCVCLGGCVRVFIKILDFHEFLI